MEKRIRKRKPEWQLRIAKERIERLLELAKQGVDKPERSRRYVQLARKIGLRYNVRLTKEQKRFFCKKCDRILIPGKTSEVRLDSKGKVSVVKCLGCGKEKRYPYK